MNKPLTHLVPALRAEDHERFDHCAGVLMDNGYGMELMVHKGMWKTQTPIYLMRNHAIVGFISRSGDSAITLVYKGEGVWHTSTKEIIDVSTINKHCETLTTYVVWKMWYTVERALTDPFLPDDRKQEVERKTKDKINFYIIREGDQDGVRYECMADTCWKPMRQDYRGREDAVKRIMQNWTKVSNMFISNRKGVFVVKPSSRKGWKYISLLEYSGLMDDMKPGRIMFHLLDTLGQWCKEKDTAERENKCKVMLMHACFCMAKKLDVEIDWTELDDLSETERDILRNYELNMKKISQNVEEFDSADEDDGIPIPPTHKTHPEVRAFINEFLK